MHSETLQFGINVSTAAGPADDPVAAAQLAEDLGFDFVSASDHPGGAAPSYETWTMLAWIAAATDRIRVATRVLGVPYRSPALVAKMAETMDRLSGGRLILGLGGGSSDHEFQSFGLGVPSPRDKIDGLAEAVDIIRGLWTQPSFSYGGRLHATDQANLAPKPAHAIPIWLGTFGPRGLDVTGRLADGWIPSLGYAHPDQVGAMRDRVLAAAAGAGRDPETITCAYNVGVRVDRHAEEADGVVSGSAGEVAGRLNDFVKLGFTTLNFMPSGPDPTEQATLLAGEVIPELRSMR